MLKPKFTYPEHPAAYEFNNCFSFGKWQFSTSISIVDKIIQDDTYNIKIMFSRRQLFYDFNIIAGFTKRPFDNDKPFRGRLAILF